MQGVTQGLGRSGLRRPELFVEQRFGLDLRVEGERLFGQTAGHDAGLAMAVVAPDGQRHSVHVGGMDPDDLAVVVQALVEPDVAQLLPADLAGLLSAPPVADAPANDGALLLEAAREAAMACGAATVTASFAETHRTWRFASAAGEVRSGTWDRARVVMHVVCVREGRRTSAIADVPVAGRRAEICLALVQAAAERATDQASRNAVAQPAPSGDLPVVFAPGAGGLIVHETLGHGCESDLLARGTSRYADLFGERLAGSQVSVHDDPSLPWLWGSYEYDDEGVQATPTAILHDGVLDGMVADRAAGEGRSTGNGRRESFRFPALPRMSNTYVAAGRDRAADIVASVKRGVYCTELGGGQADPAADTFAFAMRSGWLIENGELTRPVRDAHLTGRGTEVLSRITALADDVEFRAGTCGKGGQRVQVSTGNPTMLVELVTVGGGRS